MIKHIIFDCFGTLIDTGSTSVNAAQRILSDVGSSVDARTFYADWKAIKRKMMYEPYFRSEKKLYEESLSEAFIYRCSYVEDTVRFCPQGDTLSSRDIESIKLLHPLLQSLVP